MLLRMKPSSLPGFVLGWHAPPARGVARTGNPPPKKKMDKPNRHYRHLIHELWGNPQNSWRSSTLFFCFFCCCSHVIHSPFATSQVTGASGQPARAPATPGTLVVRHPHPLTHTHTPNNNKNMQIEDIATMTHKSTMFAHNIASLFRKGGHTHKTKMETQTTHTMNK